MKELNSVQRFNRSKKVNYSKAKYDSKFARVNSNASKKL